MKYVVQTRLPKNKTLVILTLLILAGGILRVACCFWGYPEHLHPDEPTIVTGATDMLFRRSFEANVYNRPDHFEIKLCALIFQIFSRQKYGLSADVAFVRHSMDFYLIARFFTVFWGLAVIPLIYRLTERIKPRAGLIAAGVAAFLPVFVQHSAYATPDMVLTFFVLLTAYLSMLYLEKPSRKLLAGMCISAAIGITIKYTCAICCIWIAAVVILDCMRRRQYLDILKDGFLCLVIVFGSCFFMAPNLFTNLNATISTLQNEARSTHVGADGLGFLGNFFYYFRTFFDYIGWEAVLFLVLGALYALDHRGLEQFPLCLGLLFWVCTSVLALHWERWGMPMYAFFVILIGVGVCCAFEWLQKNARGRRMRAAKVLLYVLTGVVGVNLAVSSIYAVENALTYEARVDAKNFCKENGIAESNSIYDGYTPFKLRDPSTLSVKLDDTGQLIIPGDVRYFILSSAMYSRYYAEAERYPQEVAMYNAIRSQCEEIYCGGEPDTEDQFGGAGHYYPRKPLACWNTAYLLRRMATKSAEDLSGPVIRIYKAPEKG